MMTMQTTSTEELKTIINQAWMDILNPDTTPMTRAVIRDLLEEAEAELTRREATA